MLTVCTLFQHVQVTPAACSLLFDNCQLELREMEMLTFLACVVVLKNRKQQSLKSYVSTVCAFSKALGAFLFLRYVSTVCAFCKALSAFLFLRYVSTVCAFSKALSAFLFLRYPRLLCLRELVHVCRLT